MKIKDIGNVGPDPFDRTPDPTDRAATVLAEDEESVKEAADADEFQLPPHLMSQLAPAEVGLEVHMPRILEGDPRFEEF